MKKSVSKKALVFGITGQDGSLLAQELLKKKIKVFGVLTSGRKNFKNLKKLNVFNKIRLLDCSKTKTKKIILNTKCDYIYFFSGLASVTKSNMYKYLSIQSNNRILIEILETVRINNLKKVKIVNASSSEIFGKNKVTNNENSDINPVSYYGLAKSISTEICRSYRKQFGLKVFNAILFNHESPLRPSDYVLQKVIQVAKKISLNKEKKIILGDLDVSRDWGWAPEYIKILIKLTSLKISDDFIICTGKNSKLREIVKYIFAIHNLDYKKYVSSSQKLLRPYEVKKISGSNKKLLSSINYKPKIKIMSIINKMVKNEF